MPEISYGCELLPDSMFSAQIGWCMLSRPPVQPEDRDNRKDV